MQKREKHEGVKLTILNILYKLGVHCRGINGQVKTCKYLPLFKTYICEKLEFMQRRENLART